MYNYHYQTQACGYSLNTLGLSLDNAGSMFVSVLVFKLYMLTQMKLY